MKSSSLPSILAAVILLSLVAAAPSLAVPDIEDKCPYVCSHENCLDDCLYLGQWTTCAQYLGNPANDVDGDGVLNTSDNCLCKANSNQANCDGDAWGDACDTSSVKWVRQSVNNQTCYIDKDNHLIYFTLEGYSSELWKDVCSGATCTKNSFRFDADCFNVSTYTCCTAYWPWWECDAYLQSDHCGTPKCTF